MSIKNFKKHFTPSPAAIAMLLSCMVIAALPGCSANKKNTASQVSGINSSTASMPVSPGTNKAVNTPAETTGSTPETVQRTAEASGSSGIPDVVASATPDIIVSSTPGIAASSADTENTGELYDQAYQFYLGGDRDSAIVYCDMILALDPSSYKANNLKGISLCFKGNYEEGMSLINKSLEINPSFPYSNFNKALGYKLQKDYNSALIWFDKAISYDPGNTWSYFGKACIYAEWNDAEKAVENLKKAIETDPGVVEVARREADLDNIRNVPEFAALIN